MSDEDEDPHYLDIKPGDRVFIEYDDPRLTEAYGGWGTVIRVKNAWQAKIKRDVDPTALSYDRHLLRAGPSEKG